ncbi:MAG: WG repeat-containing protein [Clostridia bacterium]|nr:WG repeat-containing protein [Clostridia bacterium]
MKKAIAALLVLLLMLPGICACAENMPTEENLYTHPTKGYALGISQFASMTWQNEKAASFRFHDQYGLINFDSNHVTAPQFESLSILSGNCFKVRKNNLYGLIDADGNQLAPCDFYDITALGDHTAVAANQQIDNSGWWAVYSYTFALLSENGQQLTGEYAAIGSNASRDTSSPSLYAPQYHDGLIRVKTADEKWGFIDNTGAEVIAPRFQEASEFSNGLAAVKQDGKWGYIGTDGNFRIEPVFLSALSFNENGRAEVQSMSGWHVIDTDGQLVYFTSQPMKTAFETTAVTEDAVEQLVQRYAAEMGSLSESGEIVVTDELRYHVEQVLVKCDGDLEAAATLLGL